MTVVTKRKQLFAFLLLLLLLSPLPITTLLAQSPEQDALSIDSLLRTGQGIPGLEFMLEADSIHFVSDSISVDIHGPYQTQPWRSDTLTSYSDVLALEDSIGRKWGAETKVVYLLFKRTVDEQAVQEYLDNLIRNELFTPLGERDGTELVLLATKTAFKPFHQIRLRILNDFKMLVLLFSLTMFFLAAVFLVIFMFLVKTKKRRKEVLTQRFKNLCYEPLSNLLFEYELADLKEFSPRKMWEFFPSTEAGNKLFKDVMIQEIISLNKNMKGDFKMKLKLVYRRLGLVDHSFKKLESSHWDVVTTGLVEINEMDVVEAAPLVQKYTHHQNFHIRAQAVATYLNISHDMSLQVLVHQTYPLSRWQQMTYFRIIRFLNSQGSKAEIERLFYSYNESVRIFGYKMVRYLGLVDRLELLLEKYTESGTAEKIEILRCFDSFSFTPSINLVHQDIYSDDPALYLAAVKVLQNIGNLSSQMIMIERIEQLVDFDCIKATLEALKALNPALLRLQFEPSAKKEICQVIAHLQDPILSDV